MNILPKQKMMGGFSFCQGSNEFTQIMLDAALGKEKLYF